MTRFQWANSGLSWADGNTRGVGLLAQAPPFLAGTQRTWNSNPVWKSILTVPTPSSPITTRGCELTPRAARCANALTSDSFHVPGNRTYRVTTLVVHHQTGALPNNLELQVDQPIPENQQRRLTLLVDNRRLHFDNAESVGGTYFSWDVPGLSWSEGDHILFGMEQRYQFDCAAGAGDAALNPTDLRAFPGLGVLTLGWINPDTNKHINYLVRWREQGTTAWINANGAFGDLVRLWAPRFTHHITGLERGADYEAQVRLMFRPFVQGCDSSSEWVSATGTTLADPNSVIWSSTLTAKQLTGGLGCHDARTGKMCSDSSVLSPTNEFTHGGNAYSFGLIEFDANSEEVTIDVGHLTGDPLDDLVLFLEVQGSPRVLALKAAQHGSGSQASSFVWSVPGLMASVDDTIGLKLLLGPPPSSVTVTASGPLVEGGPPVNVFFTLDQPALADYGATLGYNSAKSGDGPGPARLRQGRADRRDGRCACPRTTPTTTAGNAVYSINFGDGLYAEFAFPVKDNDPPPDPCTGVLGSHVPTSLSLEQISVDGTPKFDDDGNWEYGFIYVTLRARLDRKSPFHDTVVVDTGSGTTAVPSPDPYDGSVGYFRMLNTRMPVPSGSDRPSYNGQRGKDGMDRDDLDPRERLVLRPGCRPESIEADQAARQASATTPTTTSS